MTRGRRHVLTPVPGESDLGIVDALAQLSFAVQGVLGRIAAEHDVSIAQARLLGILRDRTLTINELANFLQLDKSSVTGLVDRGAERGTVCRRANAADGRSVKVAITAAGRRLIDSAQAAFEKELGKLIEVLSPVQTDHLSEMASELVAADARRRGIDLSTRDGRYDRAG